MRLRSGVVCAMVLTGALASGADALAQPAGSAGAPSRPVEEVVAVPIEGLRERTDNIRALVGGELALTVDPAELFEVRLADESAVRVEVARLRAVLEVLEQDGSGGGPADGGSGGAPGAGGAGGAEAPWSERDPHLEARLNLDRVTLSFLERPQPERQAILDRHRLRQDEASEASRRRADARREEKEATTAKERALALAERASSAAQRLLAEETARLNGIRAAQASRRHDLVSELEDLEDHGPSELIEWQSRIEGWVSDPTATPTDYDEWYRQLDTALALTRAKAGRVVEQYRSDATTIPTPGPVDPLATLGDSEDVSALRVLRGELLARQEELRALEDRVAAVRARFAIAELEMLQRGRLALLDRTTASLRGEIVGFGTVGRHQARSEIERVGLVLLYHVTASQRWIQNLLRSYRTLPLSVWWGLLKVVITLATFAWWHRRSGRWLEAWRARAHEREPAGRLGRWLHYLARIRSPAEWLALYWILRLLVLPASADLVEMQILGSVLSWMLGEAVVVNAINAAVSPTGAEATRLDAEFARTRLRSLHFVGRVIVMFGLGLSLIAQLAGEGTLHQWVVRASVVAAVPVLLVPIYWSRAYVFHRLSQQRKPTALSGWVQRHSGGALTFVAALAGATYLVARGISRAVRGRIGAHELSRRALAYWFRRELSRQDEVARSGSRSLAPLVPKKHAALDPGSAAPRILDSTADPMVARILARVKAPGGGVYVVVGERGSGKSTLLGRIRDQCDSDLLVCPFHRHGLLDELRGRLSLPRESSEDDIREALLRRPGDVAILVDDAHHLVCPRIGGLDDFDRIIQLARESSQVSCTWVFVIDVVIWQFIQRARGARPLFDDVVSLQAWTEDQIAELIEERSRHAAIVPRFDDVVTDLPHDADEVDRQDALTRAETSYYRLLWDYARGNPGVALHFWRDSLGSDEEGSDWVHLFSPPITADIEQLPDDALFVLRAIVQLDRAVLADIAAATMLPGAAILNTLRYAVARGYVEVEEGGRYRVSWQWFRGIVDFLGRRHLLVTEGASR